MSRGVFVLLLLALMAPGGAGAQEQATQVRVDAVRVEPLSQTVPSLGRLVASQRGEVATRVAGGVQRMEVQVGDRVAAGDVMALVDEVRLQARCDLAHARVMAANAQISAERADLSLLEQERARLIRLRDSAAFSPAALDDKAQEIEAALARIARAEAQLEEASAELALAERDLADARVVAPYPGVVTQRYVSAGGYVQTGEPVVALIDDTSLEIEADIPSDQARRLRPGEAVGAAFESGPAFEARVRALVPDENPLTRTVAVRFEIDLADADLFLASGRTVTLEIPIGDSGEVATVDKDAVLRRTSGDMVYVAEDGSVTPRPVRVGAAVGQRFVVEEGLAEGELVVVRGNERLRPGQAIAYDDPRTTTAPTTAAEPAPTDGNS